MISLILCAAGSGTRAGFPENKVLKELNGLPVLCYSLSAFSPLCDEILVACREEDEARITPLLSPYPARTVLGGATRAESVYRALERARGEIVLVHDAARPFVSHKLIKDCIAAVQEFGSGVCSLPATDTTVILEDGKALYPDRGKVFTVQTPQGFEREKLLRAYRQAFEEGARFTDESGVYSAYVGPVHLFPGERQNKKLTFAEDFFPAERVGFGADTHAFAHQEEFARGIARLNLNYISLCGVVLPSDRALVAHSDGDVAVHALMDALLSAAGLRDIGYYFPDSDERYRGANSMKLLQEVMELVKNAGFSVKNASISILAETPRLSPYIEKMRETLRGALGCTVAVAAGTNEKLGYVGEGKGITAYACVLLQSAENPENKI